MTRMSQWEATKRAANQKGGRGLPGDLNAEGRKWRVSGGRCGAAGRGGMQNPLLGPEATTGSPHPFLPVPSVPLCRPPARP